MQSNLPLAPSMGELVLQRLQQIAPTQSLQGQLLHPGCYDIIIAGQAVASAVSELFGGGTGVVYNDIDAFVLLHPGLEAPNEPAQRKGPRSVVHTLTQSSVRIEEDYGQLKSWSERAFRLRTTRREGLLNEVLCDYYLLPSWNKQGALLRVFCAREAVRFLQTFDLNCVQVGVRLSDKSLVWTPAFERFHRTREMLVETVTTPLHTAIRWFKKKRELEGVYGHDDRAMELLCAAHWGTELARQDHIAQGHADFLQLFRRDPPSDMNWAYPLASRMVFSKVYKSRLDEVARELGRYFNVRELADTRITLYTLEPRQPLTLPAAALRNMPRELLPMYTRARQGLWKKHISQGLLELFKVFETPNSTVPVDNAFAIERAHATSAAILADTAAWKSLQRVRKLMQEHACIFVLSTRLPFEHTVSLCERLEQLAKEKGRHVFGLADQCISSLNAELVQCSLEEVPRVVDEVLERTYAEALQAMQNAKFLLGPALPVTRFAGFEVQELRSVQELFDEGQAMHHCVGGYIYGVAQGACAILRLRKPRVQECLTLEVRCNTYPGSWRAELYSAQVRGLANRRATPEEEHVAELLVGALNFRAGARGLLSWKQCLRLAQRLAGKDIGACLESLACFRFSKPAARALWVRIKRMQWLQKRWHALQKGNPLEDGELIPF